MKLYYAPGACSLAPHIIAAELGIKLDLVKVNLMQMPRMLPDGRKLSDVTSKNYVPALETADGKIVTEVVSILLFLASRVPGHKLVAEPYSDDFFRQVEWLSFISSEVHKTLGALFNPMITPAWRDAVVERLSMRLDWLSRELGDKPFLMGDEFSLADAYLFTVLNWAGMVQVDLGPWGNLTRYQGQISQRPSAQQALKEEGLIR